MVSPARERDEYLTKVVSIDSLLPADSPRLAGESSEHARMLAESEAVLPPILVQQSTMRVIDGMHRIRAALLRGQEEVLVRLYEGDDEDVFIIAVEANTTHGLPLSLADRTAAAARVISARPSWSDRKVGSVTGLAATTVGAVRRRLTERSGQLNTSARVGRDGKVRPLGVAEGRIRAGELIKGAPDASLREIAKATGISPATALDVRNRLRNGEDPVPERQRPAGKANRMRKQNRAVNRGHSPSQVPEIEWEVVLQRSTAIITSNRT